MPAVPLLSAAARRYINNLFFLYLKSLWTLEAGREGGDDNRRGERDRRLHRPFVQPPRSQSGNHGRTRRPGWSPLRRARTHLGLFPPLRRHQRGPRPRRRPDRRDPARPPRRHVQQRRNLHQTRHAHPRLGQIDVRPRPRRQRHGDLPGHQARGARHGPGGPGLHHQHRQRRGVGRRRHPDRLHVLQAPGGRADEERRAAAELGKYGIRVNCVSPFVVGTPLAGKCFEDIDDPEFELEGGAMSECVTLQGVRLGGDDVAEAALYLASDESKYVTGHNLVVDGSFSIFNPAFTALVSKSVPATRRN
ncbi:hypothetical protein H6P81_003680 [Aristolochia fimbriata]|uniref:Uncharacterized protein n=1 Tax=Aristolochia fimbriata TaxID=158543 RepID=A0AAV7FDA2_ARIFI|nr:hypothetical protein H6P81_003680 [Aristolochia fimbriata]